SSEQIVIGVNKFRPSHEDDIPVLQVDNSKVRKSQIERLQKLRAMRDEKEVERTLNALTHAAQTNQGNLLELAIKASRVYATVGEISLALEKTYGRHQAQIQTIKGVYRSTFEKDKKSVKNIDELVKKFETLE